MPGKGGSESRLGLKAWLKKGGVAMDWSYFVLAELLFFVLFLLFLIWQYLSLKRDKALLKAQRAAEKKTRPDSLLQNTKGCLPNERCSVYKHLSKKPYE
ncbi:MAG: hypothetical protein EBS73_05345 [Betaproteobacteria bacterium]|nr:hypothetical protein [Betaproteobacteria bacterium]